MKKQILIGLWLYFMTATLPSSPINDGAFFLERGLFRIPLQVTDNSGVYRSNWPITSGIPFPAGIIKDTTGLLLVDEDGVELPAQFSVLSRYSARDYSIRWLLVDSQISLDPSSSKRIFLTNIKQRSSQKVDDTPPIKKLIVTEKDDQIKIDTGPLQATLVANKGNIFESVVINDHQIIGASQTSGSYIQSRNTDYFEHFEGNSWNTHGWEKKSKTIPKSVAEDTYFGGLAEAETVIEEQGPLRTTIRIRGKHLAPTENNNTIQTGLYNYTLRLHFFAGKSFVRAELDFENSSTEQPQWNYPFLSAGFMQDIILGSPSRVTAAFSDSKKEKYSFASTPLKPGETVRLEQSIANNSARRRKTAASLSKAQLSKHTNNNKEIKDTGNIARFIDVSDDQKGLTLAIRYFWQEGPRAIEVTRERITVAALSNDYTQPPSAKPIGYDLDFGERYINDILLFFHGSSTNQEQMLSITEAFEYPLVAVAPIDWHQFTQTWYFEVAASPSPKKTTRGASNTHWVVDRPKTAFRRERTNYNSGGHHGSLSSSWLNFIQSGSLESFERLEASSRWHIAHNPGWAYRDNKIETAAVDNPFSHVDRQLVKWDKLTGFGPKEFYLWRDSADNESKHGGESYLNRYKQLPDMEHYANFILFEYYYLTGDKRALDSIHGFVNWALNFQHINLFDRKLLPVAQTNYFSKTPEAMRRGHYSRIYSWMLYTTLAGFHATESPIMDHFAVWQIRRALSLLRHRHGQFTAWDVQPGILLHFLEPDLQQKIANHFDYPLVRKNEPIYSSGAKSWMEAQNVLAMHEAYKTYEDERILDALWGMADYFANHVIFYPKLGAFTGHTGMPTPLLTRAEQITPQLHDRHIQALPLLYHYTGWSQLEKRYNRVEEVIAGRHVNPWFTQTKSFVESTLRKHSSNAPEQILDLQVKNASNDGITLTWTSPLDDGPLGKASTYFIKISDKPITEFAPTDNPARQSEKTRIVEQVQQALVSQPRFKAGQLDYRVDDIHFSPESPANDPGHPDWHTVNAFWMAEHVDGEPTPKQAGQPERFTIRHLNLHNWFGHADKAPLSSFASGKYYIAICSWDEDKNLSALSNVIEVSL